MIQDPEPYLRQAFDLTEANLTSGELPIAALLILRERVIASASTKEQREGRFLIHAELKILLQGDDMQQPFEERTRSTLFTSLEPA